jgi:hypothetical protein
MWVALENAEVAQRTKGRAEHLERWGPGQVPEHHQYFLFLSTKWLNSLAFPTKLEPWLFIGSDLASSQFHYCRAKVFLVIVEKAQRRSLVQP